MVKKQGCLDTKGNYCFLLFLKLLKIRIKIVELIHLSLTYFKNVSLIIDSKLVESNFIKIGLVIYF